MKHIHYILLLLLIATITASGQEGYSSGLEHALRYTPWQLSCNPAGIIHTPVDSLLEARIGYRYERQPISLSNQPEKIQQYGASVDGYSSLGRLQLAGGLSWKQDIREGVYYNLLLQPDYLVTAGDTLGNPQRVEEYHIYGKAAYHFSSVFSAGIGGDYTAASNKDDSDGKNFTGTAHTTAITAGIVYNNRQLRMGLSTGYTHRTELLAYQSSIKERLYTYPLGFYLNMGDFNISEGGIMRSGGAGSSYLFRSIAHQWNVSAQAEWRIKGRSWFNTFTVGRQTQEENPDKSGNMKGWEEQFTTLEYRSRITLPHRRWTHIITPSLLWKQGVADRILQHINNESLSGAWKTYAIYRLASRTQARAELCYEAIQDYTPSEDRQAWTLTASWYRHEEKFYCFPMTIAQITTTLQGAVAYRYTFTLRRAAHLTVSPFFSFLTGFGTEESVSQPDGTPETENKLPRSNDRVSNDYKAYTATRMYFGLQAEYRRAISSSLSAGLRLSGGFEQMTGHNSETGGNIRTGVFILF